MGYTIARLQKLAFRGTASADGPGGRPGEGFSRWKRKERKKMKDCYDKRQVTIRLNRVMGQIAAVKRMIEDDNAKCEDIIIQIHAADAALHRVGLVVLEGHLGHCVRKSIENGRADEAIKSFVDSLNQYVNIR